MPLHKIDFMIVIDMILRKAKEMQTTEAKNKIVNKENIIS